MATAAAIARVKEITYLWEGKDKSGKVMKGQMRAGGEAVVNVTLRRQGIIVTKVQKQRLGRGGKITDKDVAPFSPPIGATMKTRVPRPQTFDILGRAPPHPPRCRL